MELGSARVLGVEPPGDVPPLPLLRFLQSGEIPGALWGWALLLHAGAVKQAKVFIP